jgi:hypothetical protein
VAVGALLITLMAFSFQTRTMLPGSFARAVAGIDIPAATSAVAARTPSKRRIKP